MMMNVYKRFAIENRCVNDIEIEEDMCKSN